MATEVRVGASSDFVENKVKAVKVNGESVIVARIDGHLCAVRNQCSHMPLPLDGGKVENGTITCPFHNSVYNLCSGDNLDWTPGVMGVKMPTWSRRLIAFGKEPQGLKTYTVIEKDGDVFVEAS